jgi:hypothetical protein
MTVLTSFNVNVQPKQPAVRLLGFNANVQAKQAAAELLAFDVDVQYKAAYSAQTLLGFDVDVSARYPARSLLTLDVHVAKKSRRWEAVVLVDGVDVTPRVTGTVIVTGQEGQNKTASFVLKNPAGVVDPLAVINKKVTIDYIQPDGSADRVFTGWVETPTYSVETGRTQIAASTLLSKQLDKMSRDEIDTLIGGEWSEYLFDEEAEGEDYANDLLRTRMASLQVDAYGVIRLVPWAVGAVDKVLTGNDLSEDMLSVTLQDSKSLVNKISVDVEYRYTRLRHREREYYWEAPGVDYWGDYMVKPYPLVPKTLIRSAIESTGWELKGAVSYQDIPATGAYTVNGLSQGWVNPSPELYAVSASWSLANRFTQTITEKYSLTFTASESIEVWGEVPSSDRSHGVTADYADDEWDDAEVYSDPPDGAVQSPNGDWIIDATSTDYGSRSAFDDVLSIVLTMYKRELLQAHRKNYVDFKLPKQVFSDIDTHHTLQLADGRVDCVGRVYSITHEFNRATGVRQTKGRLVLSRAPATGSYTETALVNPAKPNVADQAVTNSTIRLGVHLGNAYGAGQLDESWTGYISNYKYYDQVSTLQQYPTAFIVDTPAIDDIDRDEREAERVAAYDISIPNDPLLITHV